MKKLKFGFDRTSLCLLYTSFIRYDSKVLDSCSLFDSDWLEKKYDSNKNRNEDVYRCDSRRKTTIYLSLIETFYAVY